MARFFNVKDYTDVHLFYSKWEANPDLRHIAECTPDSLRAFVDLSGPLYEEKAVNHETLVQVLASSMSILRDAVDEARRYCTIGTYTLDYVFGRNLEGLHIINMALVCAVASARKLRVSDEMPKRWYDILFGNLEIDLSTYTQEAFPEYRELFLAARRIPYRVEKAAYIMQVSGEHIFDPITPYTITDMDARDETSWFGSLFNGMRGGLRAKAIAQLSDDEDSPQV